MSDLTNVAVLVITLQLTAASPPLSQPIAPASENTQSVACPEGDVGIVLPRGFCATIFGDRIGHARHLAVARDGTVYVNTWSGPYYGNAEPLPGGFLVALKDTNGDGRADETVRFGETFADGGSGGTGIAIFGDWLYAEANDRIVRYALSGDETAPKGKPETILSKLPLTGDHPMHPFAIDAEGNLFVSIGSATNACQEKNRMPSSPGHKPCKELETRGGIWRYNANKANQVFSPSERFATGLRNGEGMDFDTAGRLFVTQHGRDQLHENWPHLYTAEQGSEQPAEEVVVLQEGADYGWPECYFDVEQQKRVLAPEYDGDGGTKVDACAQKEAPVATFPAHWAPNDLKIYKGTQFPEAYRGGAFIAFHGSWNRAPGSQGGYNVVFQPFVDGKAAGNYVVFADGFAGAVKEPGKAAYRPSGLAVGPDGSLFIAEDVHGRIWRINFNDDVSGQE